MVLSLQKMKSCTVPKFQFLSPGLKIIFKRNPAKYHNETIQNFSIGLIHH